LKAKKLTVEGHKRLILRLLRDRRFEGCPVVLLGGPEDTERNDQIARGLPVTLSPTMRGLRDGLASVAACDVVFTGDSLGLHMAIALRKWVVAWFGPSCAQEIDLYGRGRIILSTAPCSPCWKRSCQQTLLWYDQVDLNDVVNALAQGLSWHTLSSKQLIPETSFSASP
jgi:heptosyltransferase-2